MRPSRSGLNGICQRRQRPWMAKPLPAANVRSMSQTKKKPAQLELFAGAGEVHALGLLGWEDALWTKPIEIKLLSGEKFTVTLEVLRRRPWVVRAGHAGNAEPTPNPS
jgi:hypothetical protein